MECKLCATPPPVKINGVNAEACVAGVVFAYGVGGVFSVGFVGRWNSTGEADAPCFERRECLLAIDCC